MAGCGLSKISEMIRKILKYKAGNKNGDQPPAGPEVPGYGNQIAETKIVNAG